jgi:hypothetical protein
VAHLFEEAQAKQEMINVCCNTIASRDGQLQKFIKQNGSLVTNPKEESYSKTVIENFEKAQVLQDEKVQLVQKASALVCLTPYSTSQTTSFFRRIHYVFQLIAHHIIFSTPKLTLSSSTAMSSD